MDVWKDLEPLRLDPETGPELITFGVLWEMAGGRDARLAVTTRMLREHFNRDGHSFRYHLEKLFALGCVHLLAREKRRGKFLIKVWHPEFRLIKRAKESGQMELPLEWSDGVDDIDEFLKSRPDLAADACGTISSGDLPHVGQEKSPADGSRIGTGEPQSREASADSPEAQTARPATARMASGGAGISPSTYAGKSPRGNPRGEIPAQDPDHPVVSAGNSASCAEGRNLGSDPERGNPRVTGKSPRDGENGGEIPAPRVRPRASLNDSSTKKNPINVSTNNEFNDLTNSTFNDGAPVDPERAQRARPAGDDREAAALQAILDRRRAIVMPQTEQRLGDVLAGVNAVAQRFAPDAQKQRVEAEIRMLINDPGTGQWLCGFAADLLLVHGQSQRPDAGKIYEAMSRLLQEFRDLRQVQARNGQKRYPLGARLNKVVHAICDAHGIPTPYKRRIARQAAQP